MPTDEQWFPVLLGLAVAGLLGCGSSMLPGGNDDSVRHQLPLGYAEILERADFFEVLSLDSGYGDDGPRLPHHGRFHGYPVLGRARVQARSEQHRIVTGTYRGIADAQGAALCFIPHHGLVARKGGQSLELVVCYTCSQMRVFAGRAEPTTVTISSASRRALEAPLRRARVPFSPELH